MAENHYVLDININVTGETAEPKAEPTEAEKHAKMMTKLKAFAAAQIVMPLIKSAYATVSQRVGKYTGSSDAQDTMDAITEISSAVGTVASGALAGSLIAPGIGTAVGAAAGVLTIGIQFAQKMIDFEYDRTWEGIAVGQARMRAGPSLNKSRTAE